MWFVHGPLLWALVGIAGSVVFLLGAALIVAGIEGVKARRRKAHFRPHAG
jgi:hypothetical protein